MRNRERGGDSDERATAGGARALAASAGLLSFLSPCVLPLVPGYVSYVTGLAGADLDAATGIDPTGRTVVRTANATRVRGRVLLGSGLFVVGFTAVFTILSRAAGGLGIVLLDYAPIVQRVVGALIVVMGLAFLGVIPGLDRTVRMRCCRLRAWSARRCWARCSRSAGCPAPARRWPRCSALRPPPDRSPAGRCWPPRTASVSASRSCCSASDSAG
ncbi:cytochrome c biogenesis CcdA family protein [Fodinicola feengrottensis]